MINHTTTTICCPICGQALAQSDGLALRIGTALIERVVTLRCGAKECRGIVVWRPGWREAAAEQARQLAPA